MKFSGFIPLGCANQISLFIWTENLQL